MSCEHISLQGESDAYVIPVFKKKQTLVVGILFEKSSFSRACSEDFPLLVAELVKYAEINSLFSMPSIFYYLLTNMEIHFY